MLINQAPDRTGYEEVQRILENDKRGVTKKSADDEPSLTSAQVADRLNRSDKRWVDSNHNGRIELTYEFSTAEPNEFEKLKSDTAAAKLEKIVPMSLRQKEYVRAAQQEYADVANVTFTEKTGGGGEGHLTHRGYSAGDQAYASGQHVLRD